MSGHVARQRKDIQAKAVWLAGGIDGFAYLADWRLAGATGSFGHDDFARSI